MNEHTELFEAFRKGSLAPAERELLEARLRSDAAFAKEFEEFNATVAIVEVAGESRLKEKLRAIHVELHGAPAPEQRGRVIPFSRWWLAVAASVLLVIGFTYVFASRNASTTELYAAHMTAYAAPEQVRGDDAPTKAWSSFADLYAEARYDEALVSLDQISGAGVPDHLIDFYRGQCQLLKAAPDARAAIASFSRVLESDNDLNAIARWYLGLAAMKQGDLSEARAQFVVLRDGSGYKHEEATALLEALAHEQ